MSGPDFEKPVKGRFDWRGLLRMLAGVFVYLLPLFYLWNLTGYPDSLGVHVVSSGKAGLFESWWYSHLLLHRHQPWDIVLFLYMWAPVACGICWLAGLAVQDWKAWRAKRDRGEAA